MISRREERQQRSPGRSHRRWFILLPLSLLLIGGAVLAAAVAAVPLPQPSTSRASVIYDRFNQPVTSLSPEARTPIPYSQIPDWMKKAIVATEDNTFWHNPGVDPKALLRAAYVDLRAGTVVQGGSTITQQLAKNLYLYPSRTIERKALELVLTLKLAATYPKSRILDLYLNTVYFGQGAYGLEKAAETYFGVHARQLDLAQSALLAGLVNAPSYYDPYRNPAAARARRAQVLQRMVEVGYITKARANLANQTPLNLIGLSHSASPAPYFVDAVVQAITAQDPALGKELYAGGYRIYTTLDPRLQGIADTAVATQMVPGTAGPNGITEPQVALAAMDPQNGYVVALVGGRSYQESPFDRAVDARRQPGSAFKPFLYSPLLATRRYTAASIMDDSPVSFPSPSGASYTPQNAGNHHLGPMPLRRALEVSDNIVAVKWAYLLGISKVRAFARKVGITSPLSHDLTLTLGSSAVSPLEMATAYSAFVNGGLKVKPLLVRKVTDRYGNILLANYPKIQRAMSAQIAYIMTDLLGSVLGPYGTASNLPTMSFPVAAKTGTSNASRDGWLVGYASNLCAAVWVGYDQPNRSLSGEGATTAGPVWSYFLRQAEAAHPPAAFPRPRGLIRLPICTLDGLIPNNTSPTRLEYFLSGTEPTDISPILYNGPNVTWPPHPGQWYYQYFPQPFADVFAPLATG